jgi:hypothetical protein
MATASAIGGALYGDVPIGVLGLDDLIAAKQSAGRPQDLADVARLEKVRARNTERQ